METAISAVRCIRRIFLGGRCGDLAGPVDCNEKIDLSLAGLHLGNVDVEEADQAALAPLRDRLGIAPKSSAQLRDRSLRSLYLCPDGARGRGAPVTNLSHNASFRSCERITPSNRGIKHLGRRRLKRSRVILEARRQLQPLYLPKSRLANTASDDHAASC